VFVSKIIITLRKSILDPQGKAVQHGIHSMGYDVVDDVRIGKSIEFRLNTDSRTEAEKVTGEVCQKLLSNPVMEDYSFAVEEVE
jgi:phosphoribosylformylglycinamidine synthase PurS subunit